jgi:ABC-type transport system involved in multi-copper enzyme maturation permease subunit
MIWLTWRQFRAQAIAALIILAAAAIYFLISGSEMHHGYAADMASCTPLNNCGDMQNQFQRSYNAAFTLLQLLLIITPALIGIFWGAPLIGREFENGTHQLAWNQSVMRSRWLAVKLAGVGIASIVTAGVLSYLLTWWAGPLDQINGNRFSGLTFATRDIVPLGYAAFAFALGTTAGLLLRRTVPAMAVTLAVFIGVQILVPTTIRPNLLPSTTVTFPVNQATASQADGIYMNGGGSNVYFAGLPVPQGAWVISAPPMEDSSGQVVPASSHLTCFPGQGPGQGPGVVKAGRNPFSQIGACLAKYDLHETVTYQPGSHYWPLQWIETGLFLFLAALLSGSCSWWIRRRQN